MLKSSLSCARTLLARNINNTLKLQHFYRRRHVFKTLFLMHENKNRNYFKFGIMSSVAGMVAGTVYGLMYKEELQLKFDVKTETQAPPSERNSPHTSFLTSFPENIVVSRRVVSPNDKSGLKLTLFQYPTCPFCCKVRAFLEYHGISYDVVEVNPVLRKQLKWTKYKKVPILLVEVEGGYQQLNDSTLIISVLATYMKRKDKGLSVPEITEYYPSTSYSLGGKRKFDILNKYFVMDETADPEYFKSEEVKDRFLEDKRWRTWADEMLVHVLSPNVYRTRQEALESFRWFSEIGEWPRLFSAWECYLMIYVGAYVMWIIGKRLKKRHGLKDNVRESLYDECNRWLKEVHKRGGKFFGGEEPNLADLAVYGVLSSIEGCTAFKDALERTRIGICSALIWQFLFWLVLITGWVSECVIASPIGIQASWLSIMALWATASSAEPRLNA